MDATNASQKPIRKWIVLINKTPHGPFEASEIRTLIEQKVLRHNDAAFLIDPNENGLPHQKTHGWKFLWQFEEFDRRLDEKPSQPKVEERRAETVTPKIQISEIPKDLLDISAEDLVFRSKNQFYSEKKTNDRLTVSKTSWQAPGWLQQIPWKGMLTASFAVGFVVFVASLFENTSPPNNGRNENASNRSTVNQQSRIPSGSPLSGITPRTAPNKRPVGSVIPPPPKEVSAVAPPPPPREVSVGDRGEIPREEEAAFTDGEDASDEITEEDVLEAKALKAKKRKAKKSRIPAAQAAEEEDENTAAEPTEENPFEE